MRRTAGLLLFLSCTIARGEIPKAGPLAQPKRADQAGLPRELTAAVTPRDNATTPEKVALGQKLFFDGRLSADGTVACATCHDPARASPIGRPTSEGIGKQVGHRNAPTVAQRAVQRHAVLGRPRARRSRIKRSCRSSNPIEMGMPSREAAVANVAGMPEYEAAFQARLRPRAQRSTISARAIAAFERTQIAFDVAVRPLPRRRREGDGRRRRGAAGRCSTARAAAWRATGSTARSPTRSPTTGSTTSASPRTSRTSWSWRARAWQLVDRTTPQEPSTSSALADRHVRARPLPRDQERARHRRVQDAELAQRRRHRPVHARRLAGDAVGRHRPLQQGRRGRIRFSTAASSRSA